MKSPNKDVSNVSKPDKKSLKEKRGFMSLRNNVFAVKLLLWKELKPLEHFLVDLIIEKTIGWSQKTAEFTIEELCEKTDQLPNHIYTALKNLEIKSVILRSKSNN